MKKLLFLILILLLNFFYASCKCFYFKKSGFGEFCRSNRNCQDAYLCLNGTCGCETCYFEDEEKCVHSRLCEIYSITNPNINPMNFSTSLRNFIIFNNSYYVTDNANSRILIFNETGLLQSQVNISSPWFIIQASSFFYITSRNGIIKTDLNFSIKRFYNNSSGYRSVYFDNSTQRLLITNTNNINFESFDLDLTPLNAFNSSDGQPHGIYMHKDNVYVSTLSGRIIKLMNYTKISSFQTLCSGSIPQITIDEAGVIALPCAFNNTILFYHINGTYLNKRINVESQSVHADFGLNGKFAIVTRNKLSIIN